MNKIFKYFLFTLLILNSNKISAMIKADETKNVIDKSHPFINDNYINKQILIENLKRKILQKPNISKSNITKEALLKSFKNVKNPEEQQSLIKILKELKTLSGKADVLEEGDRIDIKNTLLESFKNFTSIEAIKCGTRLMVLYKVAGILNSENLVKMIEDLTGATKTISWGGTAISISLIIIAILKTFS